MPPRTPRGQEVLAELRSLILTGAIPPGSLLVEPQLAERFATSKTPVREALHVLAAESLVAVLPKKGYLVAPMSARDLGEVLDLRMLLEPHAAFEAARHASPADVTRLTEALHEQHEFAGTDPLGAMRAAARFHRDLAGLSRNVRLGRALEHCFDETARAHHVLPGLSAHMGEEQELAEHDAVLEAVAAGDAPAARAAMQAHLHTIRAVTLAQWTDTSDLWG